jgi:membrane glycosyltransferase
VDPYVNGVHVSLLDQAEITPADESLAERCLSEGPAGLTKNELSELLYLSPAMLMMHRAVWLRPAEGIHDVWTQAVESYRRRIDPPTIIEPS